MNDERRLPYKLARLRQYDDATPAERRASLLDTRRRMVGALDSIAAIWFPKPLGRQD